MIALTYKGVQLQVNNDKNMFQLETKLDNVMDELWKLMQINKRSYRNNIRQTIDKLNSSIETGYDNKVSE